MPGLGVAKFEFEMCMKRTSALQVFLPVRKCRPTAPAVEVDPGRSRRDLCVGKQNPSAKLDVRDDAAGRVEIPNEREGIYRCAISRIRWLKNHEDRDCVDRILESPAQQVRAVRRRDDPAVTKSRGPNAGVLRNPIRSVSSRGPKFYLVPICLRPILCAQRRSRTSEKQSTKKEPHSNGLHK